MKRIVLLLVAIGGYLAYRRRQEDRAGYEATAVAEPFSSESLSDEPAPPSVDDAAAGEPAPPDNTKDTLERPTWLEPADAADGDAA